MDYVTTLPGSIKTFEHLFLIILNQFRLLSLRSYFKNMNSSVFPQSNSRASWEYLGSIFKAISSCRKWLLVKLDCFITFQNKESCQKLCLGALVEIFQIPKIPKPNGLTKSTLFAVKRLRGVYNSSDPFIANRGGGERGLADRKLPKSRKVLQNILQNFAQSAHPQLRPIVLTNIRPENK